MVKFQPLQELNAMYRAELMLSAGASAAGKNEEGRSTNKMSLNLLKHICDRFDIINYEQDLLDIDGNTALHSVVRVHSQDVSFCQETTTVQNVAYQGKDFGADTVSSEHGREYVLKDLEPEDRKEMPVTNFKEVTHTQMMKDHSQQGLCQEGTQIPDQGCGIERATESIPSSCDHCQELFKDSKQYFRNGDLEKGYYMLVTCLEFEHQSRRHKKIVNKIIALIVRKLEETTTDDIPDILVTMSEAMYRQVIEKLISGNKWIQVNAAIQKYCNRNGSDKMINFASTTNIVEKVIKDTTLRAQEDIKLQTVTLMLDIGVLLDKHDGKRLAGQAAVIGHFKVVVELLKRGCAGDTPIHAAVEIVLQTDLGNLKLFETLLCQFDADPEKYSFLNPSQVDAKGNGLFHLLANCKFSYTALQAIEMLCARNLDPRVRNYEGRLPVEYIMNADDQRKKFLCIAGSTEVPKRECNSTDTESGANENATQIKIKDETKMNVRETVKPSTGRKEQKRRIEEVIRDMESVNLCVLNQSPGRIGRFGGKFEASEKKRP